MKPKHIRTQQDYDLVAAQLEDLKDASPGTTEAKELKRLTKLLVEYETKDMSLLERLDIVEKKM